ncbi:MAG: AAA family ATPase [Oscillospiraceae bacterium]|nr:AAA family ATPase [Oscillospiraceae bacterium]
MKQLYLIGGPMGVGKTTVCQLMKQQCNNSVFLDGDWCWDAHPFQVTEETKSMVMENICFLLNQFLRCSAYETIIFCWVLHEQEILDQLLSKLEGEYQLHSISLLASPEELCRRLQKDIDAGLRESSLIQRSLERLPLYNAVDSRKIDCSNSTPLDCVRQILQD